MILKQGLVNEDDILLMRLQSVIRYLWSGIFELHSNNIIHRDLKSENILIGSCDTMIADYGISKK